MQSPNMSGTQAANKPKNTESDTQDAHLVDRMKYVIINLVVSCLFFYIFFPLV